MEGGKVKLRTAWVDGRLRLCPTGRVGVGLGADRLGTLADLYAWRDGGWYYYGGEATVGRDWAAGVLLGPLWQGCCEDLTDIAAVLAPLLGAATGGPGWRVTVCKADGDVGFLFHARRAEPCR